VDSICFIDNATRQRNAGIKKRFQSDMSRSWHWNG